MPSASMSLNSAVWSNRRLMRRSTDSLQTPIRHDRDMRYEIRIADRIGPLVASALQPAWPVAQPQRTRLTVLRGEPLAVAVLLQPLNQMNLAVELVRCRGTVPG